MKKTISVKHIDDTSLSIERRKYGRGYQYFDERGRKIDNAILLKRLRSLVIPPMWDEVRICKWTDGHIQAIGRDTKGRKQYIYHSEWHRQRQQEKFERLVAFGEALPSIRKIAHKHVKAKKWSKSKVLGLLILILDETGIRIGNRQYLNKNETFGLTTLRRRHVELEDGLLTFEYAGKSNQERTVEIEDESLIKMIRQCADLPGYELFRYKTGSRSYEEVDSDEVNEYIRKNLGDAFSSKDFRTWVASRYAIELYPDAIAQKEQSPRRKFSNILMRFVADALGNTPTVCKSYYIHPTIMQKIDAQSLHIPDGIKDEPSSWGFSKEELVLLQNIT